MPTASQREAARQRADAQIKAGAAVQGHVVDDDVMLDLAVAHDIAPRTVFAAWLQTNRREAMDRLFTTIGAAGTTTPTTPVSAASGRPVAAGTTAPDDHAPGMTMPGSVTRSSGVKVGATTAKVSGESMRGRVPSMPTGEPVATVAAGGARATIAASQAKALADQAASQAGRVDQAYRPSVTGNASGAAWQRELEAADHARIAATQAARFAAPAA